MHHRRPYTAGELLLLLFVLPITTSSLESSHNITAILDANPRFSTFNHHLTTTGLANLINNVTDITVCVLDKDAMVEVLSLKPSPASLKRMLLFHIFTGYSYYTSLRQSCCAWTMFPRPTGAGNEVVDLSDIGDGKVSFTYPFYTDYSQLLGFIKELPPRLSVIHVSRVLPSPEAWALRSPIETLKIMSGAGCGSFAESVGEVAVAGRWFRENAYVGMTVLCPVDGAWERFLPRFGVLKEEEKADLLLFHGIPVYHRRSDLRDSAAMGDGWRPSTLASYKRGNGGFGEPKVNMSTEVGRLMVGVGYDEEGPLGVYPIKGVLLPDHPIGVEDYTRYLDLKSELMTTTTTTALPTNEEFEFPRFRLPAPAPQPSVADANLEVEDQSTFQSR